MQEDIKELCALNGIAPLKPQVYKFQFKNKSFKVLYKTPQHPDINKQRPRSNTSQIQWKPKIPTKRLLQQPKFLLSLQRKKIKVINGLEQSQLQQAQATNKNFKGQKIRLNKTSLRMRKNEQQQRIDSYIHTDLNLHSNNLQRPQKTPIINFNLHHLIQKRKTYKLDNLSNIHGSNNPYYQYVASNRFNKTRKKNLQFLITRSKTHIRNRSYQNSSSKTVELKVYRQSDHTQQNLG